ncbi:MAG: amidase [Mesorhizobium sp.]|uniref:amidase n=1 Tax=Mesorhizobium sp. TaxID=1871066 RepID=UPI000FE6E095|nr:amidase [Mesorhizobium sp.]RWD50801.1 MAG: amidase [Mesorhizobium sp.]RWE58698.1 MAG: amidase [Mesorhizobium sp.]RWF06925.1 MAG: amidase [Mesorhizobium sp.]RWF16125.1 MAG: amidase [Mesorhizobium sp.]
MKLSEYVEYDATGLASLVSAGDVTPVELARLARQAHDEVNPRINAVVEFYEDAETVAGADGGPFHGVPFLRKDMGHTEAGRLQEFGSRLFEGNRPRVDSYFIQRARAAGLRLLGRTTTSELGIGSSESALCGVTRNPWDLDRTTGGSTAGSAAAVAAGIVPIASGSDGGGSIRVPASFCGLVGLNPSRGRISDGPDRQDGGHGRSRTFVMCRTVRDMAAALDVFSGPHSGDPFIIVQPDRPYISELSQPTGVLRIGVARTRWDAIDIEPDVMQAVDSTARLLEEMGHSVVDVEAPYEFEDACKLWFGLTSLNGGSLEISAQAMGRSLNAETVEPVTLKLNEYGKNFPLSYYREVQEALRIMRLRVGEALHSFDIVVTPTMPTVAFPLGSYHTTNSTISAEEFMKTDAGLYFHLSVFNITGQPSVSLPLAQSADGLPIGLQFVGRFGAESTLVRMARDLEEASPWSHRRANVRAGNCEKHL